MKNYWEIYFSAGAIEEKLQKEFQEMVAKFREQTKGLLEEVLGDLETKYLSYLFDDTATNLRNALIDCMRHESMRELRDQIFNEHKEEIYDNKMDELEKSRDLYRKMYDESLNRY